MTEIIESETKKSPVLKLCCGRCGYLLAMKDKNEVSIKIGDYYIYFYGGVVITLCRGCGSPNLIVDEKLENEDPEISKRIKRNAGDTVRVKFEVWNPEYKNWQTKKELEQYHLSQLQKIRGEKNNV